MKWKKASDHPDRFWDGESFLVACRCSMAANKTEWWYEYYFISASCDEESFDWKCNGDMWDMSWDDVSYYIEMKDMPRIPEGAAHDRA